METSQWTEAMHRFHAILFLERRPSPYPEHPSPKPAEADNSMTNYIYSKLVSHDSDIIGMVAYGYYKHHKIEFIKSIRQKYDREPNELEWEAFSLASTTDDQLEKYLSRADSQLATFVMNTAGEQIKESERRMLENYQENIKKVLPSNWKTIFLGMIGSFIFSVVVTVVIILAAFSEKDKADTVNKVINESLPTKVESIPPAIPPHNPGN